MGAFLGRELVEDLSDCFHHCLDGSGVHLAQQSLQFGQDLLDRVEVWAIRREIEKFGADRADRLANDLGLVAAEIVQHDDVATTQNRSEAPFHASAKAAAVDRFVDDPRRMDAVAA